MSQKGPLRDAQQGLGGRPRQALARFPRRLKTSVAMTSDVKGGEQLFLGLHNVFAHRASEEAEPVRDDG